MLIEPRYEGNLGFVARVMKNFGFSNLILVNPVDYGERARRFASHATDILDNATILDSSSDIDKCKFDIKVSTTGIRGKSENRPLRVPFLSPIELREKLSRKSGNCGIFFGREDHGLPNEVLRDSEIILSIQTSEVYPVMNLSHAVCVVLYELYKSDKEELSISANQDELNALYSRISDLIRKIDYPDYKIEKTELIFKRIFGRAILTGREAHTLSGFFKEVERKICNNED